MGMVAHGGSNRGGRGEGLRDGRGRCWQGGECGRGSGDWETRGASGLFLRGGGGGGGSRGLEDAQAGVSFLALHRRLHEQHERGRHEFLSNTWKEAPDAQLLD